MTRENLENGMWYSFLYSDGWWFWLGVSFEIGNSKAASKYKKNAYCSLTVHYKMFLKTF